MERWASGSPTVVMSWPLTESMVEPPGVGGLTSSRSIVTGFGGPPGLAAVPPGVIDSELSDLSVDEDVEDRGVLVDELWWVTGSTRTPPAGTGVEAEAEAEAAQTPGTATANRASAASIVARRNGARPVVEIGGGMG